MKYWWSQRNQRERLLLGGGAALLLIMLAYFLIWQPFQGHLHGLRQSVSQQRGDLAWMRQAAAEIMQLQNLQRPNTVRTAAPTGAADTGSAAAVSLPTLVDQSARGAGLAGALKRVEPQDHGRLQIRFERVGFDPMLRWLYDLQQEHGIDVINAVISRQDAPGRVDAQLILQGKGIDS